MWEMLRGVCNCAALSLFRVFFPSKPSLVLSLHLYSSATDGLEMAFFDCRHRRQDHKTPTFPSLLSSFLAAHLLICCLSCLVSEP